MKLSPMIGRWFGGGAEVVRMEKRETLDTIWAVPDDRWTGIEPIILELATPRGTGRKRANPRRRLDGIIYRTRSSCHRG
jgi:hypothetical protein